MIFVPETTPQAYTPEETYFEWYLKDLLASGIIVNYFRPKPIEIVPPLEAVIHKKNTKNKIATILQGITYEADFVIEWNVESPHYEAFTKSIDYLTEKTYSRPFFVHEAVQHPYPYSLVDVKPNFNSSRAHSNTSFPIKQKLIALICGLYVHKIVLFPNGKKKATKNHLFPATFTPSRFFYTDKDGSLRKINFKTRTIDEYIESI
jgi:hypothetical protein